MNNGKLHHVLPHLFLDWLPPAVALGAADLEEQVEGVSGIWGLVGGTAWGLGVWVSRARIQEESWAD